MAFFSGSPHVFPKDAMCYVGVTAVHPLSYSDIVASYRCIREDDAHRACIGRLVCHAGRGGSGGYVATVLSDDSPLRDNASDDGRPHSDARAHGRCKLGHLSLRRGLF